MTFPSFTPLLGNGTLAIGAYAGSAPAGLILARHTRGRPDAEILSLYIDFPSRLRGLGFCLLQQATNTLRTAGVQSVHAVWSGDLCDSKAFASLLAKCGWSAPDKRLLVLRGSMTGNFGKGLRKGYAMYEQPDCLPRKYRLSRWAEMNEEDRRFIRSRQGLPNWHDAHACPFREEHYLEPDNSLILRKENAIVGWLTVHRTSPDTLRYTDVFIREDLKRASGVCIAMVTHAFWLQLKAGTPNLTMAVRKENEPLVRLYQRRMNSARLNWTWGAEKTLSA